jgi:dihydroxy-acid dehydratase
MYTANTLASAIEALGMSLPYSSSTPAEDSLKLAECAAAATAIKNLLELDLKPRDIMTREAFENAMVLVSALGGSTNAVLHLLAIARSVGVELSLDDFQRVSDRVPLLSDFKPSGPYVMEDLHNAGGIPALMKMLLAEGALHGNCLTVTGKTVAENLKGLSELSPGQQIVHAFSKPLKPVGHIQILRGNLAPERRRCQDHGKGGPSILRPIARLRLGGVDVGRAGAQGNSKRRRHCDSLRRTKGRPRDGPRCSYPLRQSWAQDWARMLP